MDVAHYIYAVRCNNVMKVHQQIAKKCELLSKINTCYKYQPHDVMGDNNCNVYGDRAVIAGQRIMVNKLNILAYEKKTSYV